MKRSEVEANSILLDAADFWLTQNVLYQTNSFFKMMDAFYH